MRTAIGIVFVALGAIGLAICGIVLLRLPTPIPGFLLQRMGTFSIMIDPVQAPIWAVLFLAIGITLLLWKPKLHLPNERNRN
jgi:hypothetical protein